MKDIKNIVCEHCGNLYSKYGIKRHIKSHFNLIKKEKKKRIAWNKGLTKETNDSIKKTK
jgi:hypothetical protein